MLKKIKIINFRNISNLEIELDPKINLFVGNNGQGKTNIVEAISYLSLLKSFKTNSNLSLIEEGKEFATIEGIDDKNNTFKVVISSNKKVCSINNQVIKKHNDFIGLINISTFAPSNVDMFKNSPSIRREFLDDEISKLFPAYYLYLSNFDKYRVERNNLLKEEKIDNKLIQTYDEMLANYGSRIINKRHEFIKNIEQDLNSIYQRLANSSSNLKIEYQSDFVDLSKQEIINKYQNSINEDLIRKQTLLGPHKDDLLIYLDNKLISEFGSQGQNRLAVIALKLAAANYSKKILNTDCLVILDDVLSELDEIRQSNLLKELNDSNQLFITSTNIKQEIGKKFIVTEGKIGG